MMYVETRFGLARGRVPVEVVAQGPDTLHLRVHDALALLAGDEMIITIPALTEAAPDEPAEEMAASAE